ncbi:Hypothetical predicted protein [Mytilus galloprovincialis]|uniref:Uncharacterized protein n=1 Tax=Mytilus galloprovincialis TaxID=29158 RepID=A0A8B6D2P6_MYTGA|nr:Hypothetical predicted protein [Mytilus galloprovincialis]
MKEEKVRRLTNLSIVTSTNVLRALFQKKILSYPERKFKNFLEDNLHYFFHLHQEREIRCCNCASSVFTIPKKNILPRVKFAEAYQKCEDPVEGHTIKDGTVIVQECVHSYKARDISLDDLDTESLSVYLLHRGDLSKIELHALNVIKSSVERLHKTLLKPKLPFEFNLDDLEQAVVSLTCPHYYQPVVKAVFESIRELETEWITTNTADIYEKQQHATSSDKELDTKGYKRDEDAIQKITKLSQSIVPAMMNKISSLDHKHKRIRIETCKTVNVFKNFTLNVQYQTIVDNSDSRVLPSLDPDIQINIKKISKGSLNILTTVDHNILRKKKDCESANGTFLERIVKVFETQPSTSSITEMDVSVEIVHQDVAKKDDKGMTMTAVPIPLAAMATHLAVRYCVDSRQYM